ncbi:MAL-like protein [Mixophyes fleayi]|uniref:MAL-like protein n=1 Tax=Mixophyes fleayi TaxID=3061075 RepID=UPI003F4DA4D5
MASQGIQMPTSTEVPDIPYGLSVFRTLPYAFILPELIFGSWVWILVAATRVLYAVSQGWVMYVAVSSFFFSLLLLMVYVFGFHRNNAGTWRLVDVIYHGITAIFYLSAAVLQASATIYCDSFISGGNIVFAACTPIFYHLNAASTFFAFLTTLLYVLHSFQSYVH